MRREDAKASSRVAPQELSPVPAILQPGRDFLYFPAPDGKESVMFILTKRWRYHSCTLKSQHIKHLHNNINFKPGKESQS